MPIPIFGSFFFYSYQAHFCYETMLNFYFDRSKQFWNFSDFFMEPLKRKKTLMLKNGQKKMPNSTERGAGDVKNISPWYHIYYNKSRGKSQLT